MTKIKTKAEEGNRLGKQKEGGKEGKNMNTLKQNVYTIKFVKDCWGGFSFFGYENGAQYTEAYDTIDDLIEQNEIFSTVSVEDALKAFNEYWDNYN